ncbi:MAG: hypothetical protein N2C14_17355, partial [Planctomycetales bacterium]
NLEQSLVGRREELRDRLDVQVFTPGMPDGRPIAMNVTSAGVNKLKSHDREQLALRAAASLGCMMGYKSTGSTASPLAVLGKAIDLLCGSDPGPISLQRLIDYIDGKPKKLLDAIGKIKPRHLEKLVEGLQTLALSKKLVFPQQGDPLDAEYLLGLGEHRVPGKTRLCVVSTKFLGDVEDTRFWVAQLLSELARWMSKSPSSKLQAIAMFDEADIYLPATGKPATKAPMENLLRRARSAGLGIFLASQSPGDFDYKCRENVNTWFLGKIKEPTALQKVRQLLSDHHADAGNQLAHQKAGEFFVIQSGRVVPLRGDRSVMETDQLSDAEILATARPTPGKKKDALAAVEG